MPSKVNWFIALLIPISPLVADSILAVGSTISFMSVSSLLPVLFALPVPDSIVVLLPILDSVVAPLPEPDSVPVLAPEPLPVPLVELDPGSSASKSHIGSLLILAYC